MLQIVDEDHIGGGEGFARGEAVDGATPGEITPKAYRIGSSIPRLDADKRRIGLRRPQTDVGRAEKQGDYRRAAAVEKRHPMHLAVAENQRITAECIGFYRKHAHVVKLHIGAHIADATVPTDNFRDQISGIEREIATHRLRRIETGQIERRMGADLKTELFGPVLTTRHLTVILVS